MSAGRCDRVFWLMYCLLATMGGLLCGYQAYWNSPTRSEPAHLAAGLSHLAFQRFDLYRVNPPLVRSVAAVPVALAPHRADWSAYRFKATERREAAVAKRFVRANGRRFPFLLTLARWACLPFSLLGGWICGRWAMRIYGLPSGLAAMTLWFFSPTVLGHASLITPDVGAASLGVAAAYAFWRWLAEPNWYRALGAGVVLGLAELTKTTWIVLFGLWPLLWVVWRWPKKNKGSGEPKAEASRSGQACQMTMILLLGLYVMNLGYGFEGSFQRLGDYGFVGETLGGPKEDGRRSLQDQNRFAGTWLGAVPVPLPKNYVMGVDLQKLDFERKMRSYLRGEWRVGGWWYYYLYALAIKVPLGTWILVLMAIGVAVFGRQCTAGWRNEIVVLAPLVVVLTLVSSQTGFNHHLRYVLPIFPFAFIWMSKVARAFEFGHRKIAVIAAAALAWSVGSSLWVYPHSLSYFNELVGGPRNGHAHLGGVVMDSNIAWGQDLLYLRCWLDRHPEAKPLTLATSASYNPSIAGIEYRPPPEGPQPGWHALSVNRIRSRSRQYEYFLRFEPVAMAGYSIYVYHVTPQEANRVRRELGLPELSAEQPEDG